MTYDLSTRRPGILAHHDDSCPARFGRPCTCGPLGYRASVEDPARGEAVLGPVVGSLDRADLWREEHEVAMRSWHAASTHGDTVDEVVDDFLESAREGRAVDSRGRPYDDEALSDLRWSLQGHVAAELGQMRIADVRGAELRRLVARLDADGLPEARTRSVVESVRALLGYAAQRGLVAWSAAETLVFGDDDQPRPPRAVPPRTSSPLRTVAPPPAERGPQMPLRTMATPVTESGPQTPPAGYVPDQVIWLVLKIVSLTFVLIALVLVAESV